MSCLPWPMTALMYSSVRSTSSSSIPASSAYSLIATPISIRLRRRDFALSPFCPWWASSMMMANLRPRNFSISFFAKRNFWMVQMMIRFLSLMASARLREFFLSSIASTKPTWCSKLLMVSCNWLSSTTRLVTTITESNRPLFSTS